MVLLVLAIVWALVLFSWIRARYRANFTDPVTTFNRSLRVLEQADMSDRRRAGVRPAPARGGTPARAGAGGRRPARRPAAAVRARRREKLRRRRDVLVGLVGGAGGTLLLGVLPGMHVLLALQVVFDLLIVGYVALLVRLRRLAQERRVKLAYLPLAAGNSPAEQEPWAGDIRLLQATAPASALR